MNDLLAAAIEAHGGAERWSQAREVELRVRAGGFAVRTKLRGRGLLPYVGRFSTSEPRAEFSPYPREGMRGVFERDGVRVEREDGSVVADRRDPRRLFRGRRNLWWDELDFLYFAGYAMWGYVCAPFLFAGPGFEVREVEPWREGAETWRRLAVTFPPEVPAHCREQVFYFDERMRLRRNDYTAEVFGSWAKAAHYCHEHREFDGVMFPTHRRVFPRARSGRPRPFPTLVWIDVESASVL